MSFYYTIINLPWKWKGEVAGGRKELMDGICWVIKDWQEKQPHWRLLLWQGSVDAQCMIIVLHSECFSKSSIISYDNHTYIVTYTYRPSSYISPVCSWSWSLSRNTAPIQYFVVIHFMVDKKCFYFNTWDWACTSVKIRSVFTQLCY